jgi:type IV pilus assembly protein PilM
MAKKATTLFIRDTGINLLVMKGEKVEKWASSPLEPGLVSQGLIVDEAQVADKVKQIFKETGAGTSKVIVALSGHDSLYRIITLPELPEAVLPEAIRREAKRTIPTPLEEVYFSYQRLPSETKGETRVFLASFPRNLVDALVRTLHQAGVKPHIMDLAPLALCRIPNEPRAIIVNARLEHLDVMVLADRLPQVIRRLVLPGEAKSLEERLPLIAEEFNRTVAFYNSSHMEKPLDATVPVFVCGDLAEMPDTWQSVVGGAG